MSISYLLSELLRLLRVLSGSHNQFRLHSGCLLPLNVKARQTFEGSSDTNYSKKKHKTHCFNGLKRGPQLYLYLSVCACTNLLFYFSLDIISACSQVFSQPIISKAKPELLKTHFLPLMDKLKKVSSTFFLKRCSDGRCIRKVPLKENSHRWPTHRQYL